MTKIHMATVYKAVYDDQKYSIDEWVKEASDSTRYHLPFPFSEFSDILTREEIAVTKATIRAKWDIAIKQGIVEVPRGAKYSRGFLNILALRSKVGVRTPLAENMCVSVCECVSNDTFNNGKVAE